MAQRRVSVHHLLLLLANVVAAEDRDDTVPVVVAIVAAVETTLVVVVAGIEFAVRFVVHGSVAVGAEFQLELDTVLRQDSDLVAGEDSDMVVVVQTQAVAVVVVGSSNCNSNIVATSGCKLRCSASDLLVGHYFALDAEEPETEDKQRMVEPELQRLDIGSAESVRMSFALLLLDCQKRLHSCAVQESGLEDKHRMAEPWDAAGTQSTETGSADSVRLRDCLEEQQPSAA